MKKGKYGTLCELQSERGREFASDLMAIAAAHDLQMYFALMGNLTTNYFSAENHSYEVSVHFDFKKYATNPEGYPFSEYTISSHPYYVDGKNVRVRVKTYYFRVAKK